MRKADIQHRKAIQLERLQRFLAWTIARYPAFAPNKRHQDDWFIAYQGHRIAEISRAARAFWLGLTESAVDAVLAQPEPTGLIGRILARDVHDYACAADVFGIEKTLNCGVQTFLSSAWASRLADGTSSATFEATVRHAVQPWVRERLHMLKRPFATLSDEPKEQTLA